MGCGRCHDGTTRTGEPLLTTPLFDGYEPIPVDQYLILHCISDFYRVSSIDLQGPSRKQPLAYKRQVLMYMLRDFSFLSYPRIGEFLKRHHTTVMHGVQRVERNREISHHVDIELNLLADYIKSIVDTQTDLKTVTDYVEGMS